MSEHLKSLPVELVAQILSHVDCQCWRAARLVCTQWRWIVDSKFCIFHGILTDDSVNYIYNSTLPFESLQVCEFKLDIPFKSSDSMSRNKLAKSPRKLIFGENTACTLCPSLTSSNMSSILKWNRDMESLWFEQNSLKWITSLDVTGLLLRNLTELNISARIESDGDNVNILDELGKMKMPQLSILRLTSKVVFENEQKCSQWYFNLFQFISKFNLKELELRDGIKFLSNNQYIDNSPILILPSSKLSPFKRKLAKCQLTSLSMEFSQMEGYNQFSLGFHLLAAQRNLTKLEICRDVELHPSFVHRVAEALEDNCLTLTQIVFAYLRDLTLNEFTGLSKSLSMCSNLKSLELMLFNYPTFPYPLPTAITNLMLVGSLDPNLLITIKQGLPILQTLQFHNVTSDFMHREQEYAVNLKLVATMPNLSSVLFFSPKMNYFPLHDSLSDSVVFQDSSKEVCLFRPLHR